MTIPSSLGAPLRGVTVLDLSWHLAGPFCSMILADLGARVIKVERPGSLGGYDPGGIARHQFQGEDLHYIALNRNKESIVLDLKDPDGLSAFKSLVRHADVVFNNFRPGAMDRLGLTLSELEKENPRIILASLSAFGATGPDRDRPGVDLVVQAEAAGMSMTGRPGEPPVRAGIPIADLAGGMWTAISILSALREREVSPEPRAREIDISLFDAHLSLIPYFTAYLTMSGFVPGPQGSGGHSPTYGAFETSDHRWVVLAVIDQQPWRLLCEALEAPHLYDDPRFSTAASRIENDAQLSALVSEIIVRRTAEDWMKRFREAKVPAGLVNDLEHALQHPQVEARNMLVDIEHGRGGVVRLLGTPIHMTGYEPTFTSAPAIGGDTERILEEFGLAVPQERKYANSNEG